jgi:hypothetical protein
MSMIATQRPYWLCLTLRDGSEERLGPYVTTDSAWAAARRWLGSAYAGTRVMRVRVEKP